MILLILLFTGCSKRLRQSCQSGLTGYYWDGQQCLQCLNASCYCESYKGCHGCHDEYYYDNQKKICIHCPLGCQHCCKLDYLTEYTCTVCKSNYKNINGVCVLMMGCLHFTTHGRCYSCQDGYYLNDICVPCSKNCGRCQSLSQCQECNDGYYLEIVDKSYQCSPCTVVGCSICDAQQQCSACIQGYEHSGNNCVECQANCEICAGSVCTQCAEDYLFSEDGSTCQSCQDQFENCMECSIDVNKYVCDICMNGYYMEEGQCKDCTEDDENVRRCDSLDIVTQCKQGYLVLTERYDDGGIMNLMRNICVENQFNCRTTNTTEGQCSDCKGRDQLMLKDEVLLCVECNKEIEWCSECVFDQTVEPNGKLICKVCQEYYYVNEDAICVICEPNCKDCDADKCYNCESGYVEQDNKCINCALENCTECPFDDYGQKYCKECADGYGIIVDKCEKCVLGCKTCNMDRLSCSECMAGYYLYGKACLRIPDHCLETNSEGFCYLCETLSLYNGTDVFADENAEDYTNDSLLAQVPDNEKFTGTSIYYKSVNGYCLMCSYYDTGVFNCPDSCVQAIQTICNIIKLGFVILSCWL